MSVIYCLRKIFLLITFLAFLQTVQAQIHRTTSASLTDAQLKATGAQMTLYTKGTFAVYLCPKMTDIPSKAVMNLQLDMGDEFNYYDASNIDASVQITLTGYSSYILPTQVISKTVTLVINKGAPRQLYTLDFTSSYNSIVRWTAKVTQYTSNNYAATRLQAFFTDAFGVSAEGFTLTPNAIGTASNPQAFSWKIDCPAFSSTDLKADIVNYQVQVLRLYNTDGTKMDATEITSQPLDWSQAALFDVEAPGVLAGVSTRSTTLKISEGSGFYIWRVRAIGNYYPNGIANSANWGPWSPLPASYKEGAQIALKFSALPTCGFYYEDPDDNKNYIYSRTFSEHNQVDEKMTYATDLLRVQQTQEHLQSADQVIVTQQVMDYSGRPTLQSLPVPVNQDKLEYVPGVLKSGTQSYTAGDFDKDDNYKSPATAKGLANSFYAVSNPDPTIPDAGQVPFKITRYYPDGTSNVKEQSLPGTAHAIKQTDAHTVRTYYAGATATELVRVFGDEAPDAKDVYKVIVADGNNTINVTYIDKNGKTIATCLSYNGLKDVRVKDLAEKLQGAFTTSDQLTDKLPYGNNGYIGTKPIVFTEPTGNKVDVQYDVDPNSFKDDCGQVCQTCDYRVEFYLYNKGEPDAAGFPQKRGPFDVTPGECGSGVSSYTCSFTGIDAGSYVVERKVITYNSDDHSTPLAATYLDNKANELTIDINKDLANNALLNLVKNDLAANNLSLLYQHLGINPSTSTTPYVINTACCSISIPIVSCPSVAVTCNTCNQNFENYLIDMWKDVEDANGNPFGSDISTYLPQYTAGQFNAMVSKMKDDTYYGATCDERCQRIWNCWVQVVQFFKAQKALADNNPVVSLPNHLSVPYHYDLLEQFLDCTGHDWKGFSGDPTGEQGYVEHAYQYFVYDGSNDGCNMQMPGYPDLSHLLHDDLETLYRCVQSNQNYINTNDRPYINYKEPVNAFSNENYDEPYLTGYNESNCIARCEKRRDQFYTQAIKYYHDHGYVIQGETAGGKPVASLQQISALTDNLIAACQSDCQLTVYEENGQEIIGSDLERNHFQQAMVSPEMEFYLSDADCDNGYQSYSLSAAAPGMDYEMLQYANGKLDVLKAKHAGFLSPVTWNYGQDITDFSTTIGVPTCSITPQASMPVACDVPAKLDIRSLTSITYTSPATDAFGNALLYRIEGLTLPENIYPGEIIELHFNVVFDNDVPGVFHLNGRGENNIYFNENNSRIYDQYIYNRKARGIKAGAYPFTITLRVPKDLCSQKSNVRFFFSMLDPRQSTDPVQPTSGTFTLNYGGNGYKLVYVENNTEKSVICNHYTVRTCQPQTAQNLCFKWKPQPTGSSIEGGTTQKPLTCESEGIKYIQQEINKQIAACIANKIDVLRSSYNTNCLKNYTDKVTISYPLNYYQYTLYYYDRAGNLVRTVPPQAIDVSGLSSVTSTTHPVYNYDTKYEYNSLNQLTRQITPDGGETKFWYNRKGQLRFSENAKQRAASQYSFTYYDALGRITGTGEALQQPGISLDSKVNEPAFPNLNAAVNGHAIGNHYISRTYNTPARNITYLDNREQRFLDNRLSYVTMSPTPAALTGDDFSTHINTYYSYDPHGNVEWMIQELPGLGQNYIRYEYDLYSNKVTKVCYNEGLADQFYHRYTYDADNRIIKTETSYDNALWDADATYEYQGYGPLKRLALGQDAVQGLDYSYTIEGWLKSINHPDFAQDPGSDDGTKHPTTGADVFGSTLSYYKGDFRPGFQANGGPDAMLTEATSLYNGNIANWIINNNKLQGESYTYDELNRLVKSVHLDPLFSSNLLVNTSGNTTTSYYRNGNIHTLTRTDNTNRKFDDLSYLYATNVNHGNITAPYTNQLVQASDAALIRNTVSPDIPKGQAADNYNYNESGFLTEDKQEGIKISWTPYGKVNAVLQTATNSTRPNEFYFYDGNNQMAYKELRKSDGSKIILYYVRDASGNIMAIYEGVYNATTKQNVYTLKEQPIYGSSRLGIRSPANLVVKQETPVCANCPPTNGGGAGSTAVNIGLLGITISGTVTTQLQPVTYEHTYTRFLNQKSYELTDHLGNVRTVISDIKHAKFANRAPIAGSYTADVKNRKNYYPFGMIKDQSSPMTGEDNGSGYRFGFNGKEQDFSFHNADGQIYDYGFRMYDARLGRFMSVDPLASKYPMLTPYQFASNTPIAAADLDGLEADSKFDSPTSVYFIGGTGTDKAAYSKSFDAIITPAVSGLFVGFGGEAVKTLYSLYQFVSKSEPGTPANNPRTPSSQPKIQKVSAAKSESKSTYTPDRNLTHDSKGRALVDEEAEGTYHTQMGKDRTGKYPQRRTIDESGRKVKDVDYSDHGTPEYHENPHEHLYDSKTGERGQPQSPSNFDSKNPE